MPELRVSPCRLFLQQGRRCPFYAVLEPDRVLYIIPPPAEGEPGFINAVTIGTLIAHVTKSIGVDPETCRHFVLFAGCDERFLGKTGSFLFARVEFFNHPSAPYVRLGTFFTDSPTPCPDEIIALCAQILGNDPRQVGAGTDWVLPPRDCNT